MRFRPRRILRDAGFTLVEALIAAGLLALVMGGLYAPVRQGVASWQAQAHRQEVEEDFRVAFTRMGKYVREAWAVKVDGNGSGLTLTWLDPAASTGSGWKEIRYEVRDGVLREGRINKTGPGWQGYFYAWQPLAERVYRVSFSVSGSGESRLVSVTLWGRDRRGRDYRAFTQFTARAVQF